jgi:hypothetical protein
MTTRSPNFGPAGAPRERLTQFINGIVCVLFSAAGIVPNLNWAWGSTGHSGGTPVLDTLAAGSEPARPKCPECGTIVSVRGSEVVVRMTDGSISMISEANPARWRTGERMMVITGTGSSQP